MQLGACLKTGDVIGLVGDLGAGKTTFVQGISAGWGSLDQVSSPTFVLVNVYRKPSHGQTIPETPVKSSYSQQAGQVPGLYEREDFDRLFHLDAYRLSGPAEAVDLDLEYFLENGPLVIEWADRIQQILPKQRLWINLNWVGDEQRDLMFSGYGRRYQELLVEFRKRVYGVS